MYIYIFYTGAAPALSSALIQATWLTSPDWFPSVSVGAISAIFCLVGIAVSDCTLNMFCERYDIYVCTHQCILSRFIITCKGLLSLAGLQHAFNTKHSKSIGGVIQSPISLWWQMPVQSLFGFAMALGECNLSCSTLTSLQAGHSSIALECIICYVIIYYPLTFSRIKATSDLVTKYKRSSMCKGFLCQGFFLSTERGQFTK